ncbi:MAG: hypothetical protein ABW221_01515 [Vicinamibacteria bacterium]
MKKNFFWAALVGACLVAAAPARAIDPWDQATEDDNGAFTDNGLTHGTAQQHDLDAEGTIPVADQDWYTLSSAGRSSYEVLVDGTTGDMDLASGDVVRIASGGTTVLQNSVGLAGFSVVLRWRNTSADAETNFIRVSGATCGTACTLSDQYRIRFYESTYSIPRFNNSGGQITVLNVASMVPFSCTADFHFYNNAGTYLGTQSNGFTARELFVLNTSTLGFAAGASGSIIVAHTCGYGGLAGKAVALEPSTGFTFDTALIARII